MSWISKCIIASTVAMFAQGAAMAGTIVVKSAGPSAKSYPPGKAIADNSKVNLKAGDTVSILDGRGVRVLKGPGTFSTTATRGGASESTIKQLLQNTGARQSRTGAVRGTEGGRAPNLWLVDVSRSGTMCIADPASISLWRPTNDTEASVTISGIGGKTSITFRPGQQVRQWPLSELAVNDGGEYRLSGNGIKAETKIKLVVLGPNPEGLEGTAAALIRNGCNLQLELLETTISVQSEAAATPE